MSLTEFTCQDHTRSPNSAVEQWPDGRNRKRVSVLPSAKDQVSDLTSKDITVAHQSLDSHQSSSVRFIAT